MKNRKFRVSFDIWMARLGTAFGWIFLAVWTLFGIVGLTQWNTSQEPINHVLPFIFFGFAAFHIPLILAAKKTRKLVKDFRLYSAILSQDPEKKISSITDALKIPQEKVTERLKEMCGRGYFNGYINFSDQRLVLEPGADLSVEYCPGCGAANAISRAGDICRYCGSPLKRTDAPESRKG